MHKMQLQISKYYFYIYMYIHRDIPTHVYINICVDIYVCVEVHLITIIIVALHYVHSGANSLILAQIMATWNIII